MTFVFRGAHGRRVAYGRRQRLAFLGQEVRSEQSDQEWSAPGPAGFPAGEFTDHYVKLIFPPPGAPCGVPFDVGQLRAELPPEQWPITRTYTVRSWDAAAGELMIDVVHHGDTGLAGPWAAAAQPGDRLQFSGPGGACAPSAEADWYLLAGDGNALPAIGAALTRLPAGVEVVWVHRGPAPVEQSLVSAVRAAALPEGTGHVFVHGQAGLVRELRLHLRAERGLDPAFTSISGYWRQGRWQAEKREWNSEVEAAEQALAAG